MLPFSMTIPATVPQTSEITEGLTNYPYYEENSKINLRLVGKKKRVVTAPERKLSINK
jgi:hypothetical protein